MMFVSKILKIIEKSLKKLKKWVILPMVSRGKFVAN
jgi:hypothetical protein